MAIRTMIGVWLGPASGCLTDVHTGWTVPSKIRGVIGELVSHYRVLSLLGSGGMGDVYLAEDTRLGRRVALKTMKGTSCNDSGRTRLLREARVLSQLNHPGIAAVYDVGQKPGGGGDESF